MGLEKTQRFLVVFGKGLAIREKNGGMTHAKAWFKADVREATYHRRARGGEQKQAENRTQPTLC